MICRQTPLPPGASMLCLKLAFCTTRLVWTPCPWVPEKEKKRGTCCVGEARSGQARSERLSAPRFPFSSMLVLAPRLIDVVTSRSPGPGLSRARRGTDIPWRMGPLFSHCPRAPRLFYPPCPMAVCGRGRGAEPGPTSVVFTPPLVFVTQRTLSALAFPGCVSRAASPRGGEGAVPPPRRTRLCRWACMRSFALALGWCPWSVPGCPSGARGRAGGVASRSPRSPPTGRRCRWCRGRRAPECG